MRSSAGSSTRSKARERVSARLGERRDIRVAPKVLRERRRGTRQNQKVTRGLLR
jgi:hypothetical protein